MKLIFMLAGILLSANAFAISCDCEVRVFSPMTGSYQMKPTVLKTYELEEYNTYSVSSQNACRDKCLTKYEEDMPIDRLHALLLNYSQELIVARAVGFNCTGLTTLKYPVRVKANLGPYGLGNVVDMIHVVTHEEICF